MVRFEFNIRKSQVLDFYAQLNHVEQKYEFRYGIFHQGTTFAEIITSDAGQDEIIAVLDRFDIKFECEEVL